jgi:hydrogenase maturation protease
LNYPCTGEIICSNGKGKAKNCLKIKILVYGIGNPGRQDDALGIILAEAVRDWAEEKEIQGLLTDQNYQLNIEDAELISQYDLVIFADASVKDIDSTLLEEIVPVLSTDFSMHSVEPAFITGLCKQLYPHTPVCYQFHVRGYQFEFMESITDRAKENLKKAFGQLTDFILNYSLNN